MPSAADAFTLRAFLDRIAAEDPAAVLRVAEPVNLDYDATALVMEMEKVGRAPVVWFDKATTSRYNQITLQKPFGASAVSVSCYGSFFKA